MTITTRPAATSARTAAARAVLRAVRTGEYSAARQAETHLADEATFVTGRGTFTGRSQVFERLCGQWAWGTVPSAGLWRLEEADGGVAAIATFPGLGAVPAEYRLVLTFDAQDQVTGITERVTPPVKAAPLPGMPPAVRRRIDRALAEGKPLVVSYVDASGAPSLSLRGSVQTYSDTELCLWLRSAEGGLSAAIAAGQPIAFLYRDSASRTTLIGSGRGRIVDDPETRREIYDLTPEVEQRHDPGRQGAAALIRIESLRGTSPEGGVDVSPTHADG